MGDAVKDWATDYDVLDPAYVRDPFPIWDGLRERGPVPMARIPEFSLDPAG